LKCTNVYSAKPPFIENEFVKNDTTGNVLSNREGFKIEMPEIYV